MEKTFIERRVYPGAPVHRGYRVIGIRCTKDGPQDRPKELVRAHDISTYSSGCPLHRGSCFGHMCTTPTGNILPPHSLSFRSGDIRTQYYIASAKAFDKDTKVYVELLKKTNYGKHGHLRSIMSTPVSGSARLVCIPHVSTDPRVVYISKTLAENIVFCAPETASDGSVGSRYVEKHLAEGDYIMLERPPSLSKYNNQPLRVLFWDVECMGVHPKVFSYFHGDYDGDEGHVFAIGSPSSIAEAAAWRAPLDSKLCEAERVMRECFPEEFTEHKSEGDMDFVSYTTLSFSQIKRGAERLLIGDTTRNKDSHMRMFRDRMDLASGTEGFLEDAIKGVKDIMRQQVHLGTIGDMSRVARVAAMCFSRGERGGTYVTTRHTRVLLNTTTEPSTGCPSVRCIMVLCQASQQAALDSHRVGSSESKGMDLVSSLLKGRSEDSNMSPQDTLVVFDKGRVPDVLEAVRLSWKYNAENFTAGIAKDNLMESVSPDCVIGAYSPVVLSRLPEARRKAACKVALHVVYNYYSLRLEGDDIDDMVEMMCYKVGSSPCPVTSRRGMLDRGLGWMETLMACDYTKLPMLAGSYSEPHSATSATMCSNFSRLR